MALKILWLSTGTLNCEPIIGSLDSIKKPEWDIRVHDYFKDPNIDFYNLDYDKVLVAGTVGPNAIDPKFRIQNSALICFDASCPDWHSLIVEYGINQTFSQIINIDGNNNWPHRFGYDDITTLAPIDPRPFEKSPKLYDVGFCGGYQSYPRREIIDYLKYKGLITVRSAIETYFTYPEYARFMSQCKIVINMPQSGGGSDQVKARVIETGLAGAALLEQKGSVTSKWFKPGLDYLEYSTKEEAEEKIKWLLNNYIELGKFQTNLAYAVKTNYGPQKFWEKIL